jgi:hypothetical protein
MIIGICGFIGGGKDTIADYLVNVQHFRRVSFAGALKDAVSSVFGWNREMLEGRTQESRNWREQRDEWWTQRLGREVTPRLILQLWGTEVCRQGYHDEIWVASLENRLRNSQDNVVITDCRFPNEIKSIRNAGGYVIRVCRGAEPEWYDLAVAANHGSWAARQKLDTYQIHPSETAWVGTEFDAVINNTGSFDHTFQQVETAVRTFQGISDLLQDLPVAMADHS